MTTTTESNTNKNTRSNHQLVAPVITADATLDPRYDFYIVDATAGPVTLTLEKAVENLREKTITRLDQSGNQITIAPAAGDTIDDYQGVSIAELQCATDSVKIKAYDTTKWIVTADYERMEFLTNEKIVPPSTCVFSNVIENPPGGASGIPWVSLAPHCATTIELKQAGSVAGVFSMDFLGNNSSVLPTLTPWGRWPTWYTNREAGSANMEFAVFNNGVFLERLAQGVQVPDPILTIPYKIDLPAGTNNIELRIKVWWAGLAMPVASNGVPIRLATCQSDTIILGAQKI